MTARVLDIDTAGPVIGVALRAGGRTEHRTERVIRGSEARLVPWAIELAAAAGLTLAELDVVAVGAGPGAFTGLRVGLAMACGVAQAAGIPVWAGSTLESRAWQHRGSAPVLALLDARKGRVYAAVFDASGGLLSGPGDVDPEVALAWMRRPFVATGEGALVYREAIEAAGGRVAERADDPGVVALAELGERAWSRGEAVAAEAVRPTYLRAPDAKIPKDMR
jgi:tRNA threonylcarbamoyladenosine biosynthesis protein TsaB